MRNVLGPGIEGRFDKSIKNSVPSRLLTVFTWIASVATGWHWAVDGIVGASLGWLAAWAGWRIVRLFEPAVQV